MLWSAQHCLLLAHSDTCACTGIGGGAFSGLRAASHGCTGGIAGARVREDAQCTHAARTGTRGAVLLEVLCRARVGRNEMGVWGKQGERCEPKAKKEQNGVAGDAGKPDMPVFQSTPSGRQIDMCGLIESLTNFCALHRDCTPFAQGVPLSRYGFASVQLDGGFENVATKVRPPPSSCLTPAQTLSTCIGSL